MKETRKRSESEVPAVDVAGKRPRASPEEYEGEGLVDLGEEFVDEESVMEVMKLLEEELCRTTASSNSSNGGSVVDEIMKQSSPLISSSSSSSSMCCSFVTESCGASFSESGSTVMADVDVSGISILFDQLAGIDEWTTAAKATEAEEEWWWPEVEDGFAGEIVDGCDDGDDEEWMERVLSCV